MSDGRSRGGVGGAWRAVLVALAAGTVVALGVVFLPGPLRSPGVSAGEMPAAVTEAAPRHPVHVNRPAGPPRVVVDTIDSAEGGGTVTVACGTCHATRTPDRANATSADLDEFHQGLQFAHGGSTCLSCHDASNYDRLRLADGRPVEFVDVLTLCAQCHGPQYRDWEHGAHGGMSGYWDLTRGPRTRNNCVDCHDPHAPAFPRMRPTFKPIDRFLTGSGAHAEREESNE